MDITTATNMLYSIFYFLEKNDITLNEVIKYGTQLDGIKILSNDLDVINEEWNDEEQDNEAMKLLPSKYKNHICIKTTPDGNCFFNSAFLIVFGSENFNIQLRLAVIIELMAYAQFYLQQQIFEQDIIYQEEALNSNRNGIINNIICDFKKENEYISELKLMCKPHSWCSMVAFFGLASVLHRPIESLFPNTNNKLLNQIYNRIILPRRTNDLSQCIIMWSSCSAKQFQVSYQANHFVPVFKNSKAAINDFINITQKSSPLQNYSYDPFLFPDDELSVIQNYLSVTDDYNKQTTFTIEDNDKSIIKSYNYNEDYEQSMIESCNEENYNNEQPIIEKNHIEREKNLHLLGLLMGIDNSSIPDVENNNGYLIYQEAKDFQFTITRKEALDKLVVCIINDQEPNYHWKPWQISNFYLVELLQKKSEFPPQISVAVKTTYESNKILTKYCYCGGCHKKEKVMFK